MQRTSVKLKGNNAYYLQDSPHVLASNVCLEDTDVDIVVEMKSYGQMIRDSTKFAEIPHHSQSIQSVDESQGITASKNLFQNKKKNLSTFLDERFKLVHREVKITAQQKNWKLVQKKTFLHMKFRQDKRFFHTVAQSEGDKHAWPIYRALGDVSYFIRVFSHKSANSGFHSATILLSLYLMYNLLLLIDNRTTRIFSDIWNFHLLSPWKTGTPTKQIFSKHYPALLNFENLCLEQ